jgi:hypothetical protein
MVELVLTEPQLFRLKAGVTIGSAESAALDAVGVRSSAQSPSPSNAPMRSRPACWSWRIASAPRSFPRFAPRSNRRSSRTLSGYLRPH